MIKVYSIIGEQNNVILDIPYGGAKVKVTFKGGNNFRGIPAKLYTKDPFMIRVLEKSELNGKLFRLLKVIPEESDKIGQSVQSELSEQSDKSGQSGQSEQSDKSSRGRKKKGSDLKFGDAAEAIEYIATKYGEQVENGSEAITYLKAQGINAVIG